MTDFDREDDIVFAAGGVVTRTADNGETCILIIHRGRYDDWCLPKGKIQPGETLLAAALREVREETGLGVNVVNFAGSLGYEVSGRPKVVLFWRMTPEGEGAFLPSEEVCEAVWLPVEDALNRLTYSLERQLVQQVLGGCLGPAH